MGRHQRTAQAVMTTRPRTLTPRTTADSRSPLKKMPSLTRNGALSSPVAPPQKWIAKASAEKIGSNSILAQNKNQILPIGSSTWRTSKKARPRIKAPPAKMPVTTAAQGARLSHPAQTAAMPQTAPLHMAM